MMSLARWKIVVIVAAILFGVLYSLPNVLAPLGLLDKWPGFLPHKTLNLGLDLRGGSYLLLEVDTAALQQEKLKNLAEDVRNTLKDAQIATNSVGVNGNAVLVNLSDPTKSNDAVNALNKLLGHTKNGGKEVDIRVGADKILTLSYTGVALAESGHDAVARSIEVMRKRLDPTGTKEIPITPQGEGRIVIQAPGESDPEKLKALIGTTAKLTFQMVSDAPGPDSETLPNDDPHGGGPTIVVKKRALVSGEDLTGASQAYDQNGAPAVAFRFNAKGASKFGQVTTQNVGKRFAIVLDGHVISSPTIINPIIGGSGQITGSFTVESAKTLSNLLSSGALPAPLKVEEQRVVTAELGKDAIDKGAVSLAIGAALIFGFIILAYGQFGLYAAAALIVNILLLVAFMSATQSTLTLPGIAGLILTLAVAVDANVLIYERMRDEARSGRSPMAAAEAGYSRALVSIIDANVTTLISAVIMLWLGQGPVRGFAVTLMVGVFTSVGTAVLITQVLISLWFRASKPKKLPIL